MKQIPRWIYAICLAATLWLIVGNIWLSAEKAETKRLEVPPITESDLREIDRQMLKEVYVWVQEQKEAKKVFEKDLKAGRVPVLPGVKR